MTWNGDTYPDGTKNLKDNRIGIADNFGYIEDKMDLDHFWTDDNANKNGRHRNVSFPTVTAPSVPTDSNGIMYVKTIADGGSDRYVLHHNDGAIARPLSWGTVWAYAVFNPTASTLTSSRNIATLSYSSNVWTFAFTTAAPSTNYMIIGGTTYNSGAGTANRRFIQVASATKDGSTATVNQFGVVLIDASGGVWANTTCEVTKTYVMVVI